MVSSCVDTLGVLWSEEILRASFTSDRVENVRDTIISVADLFVKFLSVALSHLNLSWHVRQEMCLNV